MMGPQREKAVSKATTADTPCASRRAIFLFYQALPVYFLANAASLPVKSFVSITCMNGILHHKRENRIRECPNSRNILVD